jgi:hypothetical protein
MMLKGRLRRGVIVGVTLNDTNCPGVASGKPRGLSNTTRWLEGESLSVLIVLLVNRPFTDSPFFRIFRKAKCPPVARDYLLTGAAASGSRKCRQLRSAGM